MKLSVDQIRALKGKQRIPMLTAYTAPVARCLEQAGIPVLLVGDTVGMVEMGFSSTREVTIEHMCYHIGAVRRGAPNTHVIGDIPFGGDTDVSVALSCAQQLLDAGADSVKLEGPKIEIISALVSHGISVVGHTGLTPQTATSFAQVGRSSEDAERIFREAVIIAHAGAYLLVLEHIPDTLAQRITERVDVPTIGIGAGPGCDGQVLVINDAIGLGEKWPPFSKQYAYLGKEIEQAGRVFVEQVVSGRFRV